MFPGFFHDFVDFSQVFPRFNLMLDHSQILDSVPRSRHSVQSGGTDLGHPTGLPHGPAVQTAPGEVLPMATPSSQGLRQGGKASGDMGFWHRFFFPNQKVPKHPDLGVAYWTILLLGYGSWMELVSVKLFLCPGGWFPRHDQVPARILWVRVVWKMANRGKDWIGILGSPWALVPLQ